MLVYYGFILFHITKQNQWTFSEINKSITFL